MLCRVTSRCVMLCYVMLCYVMLCYVMLCYVMLLCVALRYVMLSTKIRINHYQLSSGEGLMLETELRYIVALRYVTLPYVTLRYVMLCYVIVVPYGFNKVQLLKCHNNFF